MTVQEFFEAFEDAQRHPDLRWQLSPEDADGAPALPAYDTETAHRPGLCMCPVVAVIHHRDPESPIETSSSQGDMADALGMAVRDVADLTQAADASRVFDTDGEIVPLFDPEYRASLLEIAGIEVDRPCA